MWGEELTLQALGLYIGLPLLIFGVIAAAVLFATRGGRAEDFPVLNPLAALDKDAGSTEADRLSPDEATTQEPSGER